MGTQSRSVEVLINAKDNASGPSAAALKGFKALRSELASMQGMLAGGFAGFGIASGFKAIVGSFTEAEGASAKLGAVLKATGNASGFSLKQLRDYAGELQDLVAVDDDVIASNMGILASFRNVQGQVFKDATKAALDMSDVMDQDLHSSIVQIGKALNDPIKGLTALGRVGVQFNAEQKEIIKTAVEAGDVLKAQQVILAELNAEFGGAAAAAADTLQGKINKLSLAFDGLRTSIGGAIAPALTKFLDSASAAINGPAAGKATGGRLDNLRAAFNIPITPEAKAARRKELMDEFAQLQSDRAEIVKRMDARQKFGWHSFNPFSAAAQAEDAFALGNNKIAIDDMLRELKQLRLSMDPKANANNRDFALWNDIQDQAPKALDAIKKFAGEGAAALDKFEAAARNKRIIREFFAGLSVGGALNMIGNVIGPGVNLPIKPGDVFGGNPFTDGGRIVNTAFENRGLHSAPFTEVKPELKTLQEQKRIAEKQLEIQQKQLRLMERDPATTRQILEIRSQLN